jgi:hypothetical protein
MPRKPRRSENWTIYGLKDPRTGEIRYVGHTVSAITDALAKHLRECHLELTARECWLIELGHSGFEPELVVLEQGQGDWEKASKRWVGDLISRGAALTNMGDGGKGASGTIGGDRKRQILSQKMKGRTYSPETIELMRQSARNRPEGFYEELAARNKARAGWKQTPEARAKMSAAKKGKPQSPELIAKRAAALRRHHAQKKSGRTQPPSTNR